MTKINKGSKEAAELRRKAEEKLDERQVADDISMDEVEKLVHELRVHQIELEMQNESLREAQTELIESNGRYVDLYDFAPVGYASLDAKGVILQTNLTLATLLGMERGVLVGLSFQNFIAPKEKPAFIAHLARVAETRKLQTIEVKLFTRRKGVELYAQIESIFVVDSQGSQQYRISVTDISDRKKAEEALKDYMKKLEASNRELQQFAFIASHDLQEPLRKVQTFGDLIAEKYGAALDDEGRDYLNRMTSGAKRMRIMIQALLDYSRVGTREKPFGTVDLTRLVREVVSDFEVVMEELGARVEVATLPVIEADSNQMRQLFQNLISNSLKFHGERKPVIKIYTEPVDVESGASVGGRTHRICVEDNGVGFDQKNLEHIFILFRRLHGRGAYEGAGIGLAICRKIVDRHHGTITARSKPGEGATFIVTLPTNQPAED